MIYTCYYLPEQREKIYPSKVYQGFGLEPEVNPDITLNCPELDQAKTRRHLVEYACCLWLWRNRDHQPKDWIGITSYRQNDKTTKFFESGEEIEIAVAEGNIATWGMTSMFDQNSRPISMAMQAEACHPGITEFIQDVFNHFKFEIPKPWYQRNTGIYANYWAMCIEDFIAYMDFSWPLVQHALTLVDTHPYTLKKTRYKTVTEEKALGYFTERLFILWYLREGKDIVNCSRIMQVRNKVRYSQRPAPASSPG